MPHQTNLILPIAESIETDRSIATFVTCASTNVFRESTSVDRTLDTMNVAFVLRLAFSSSFDRGPLQMSSAYSYETSKTLLGTNRDFG